MKHKKIIARCNDIFVVCEDNTTLDDIYNKAILVDINGRVITSAMTIASILKSGDFVPFDGDVDNIIKFENPVKNALVGAAVGDAFGVPYEFLRKKQISEIGISDEMIGCNSEKTIDSRWGRLIPKGSWSDDTSMIVATMESMIKLNSIDYTDIMNNYMDWITKGNYTSIDKTFGLGSTVKNALYKFYKGSEPLNCGGKEFMDNGNGSLMRILPFSLYCALNNLSSDDTFNIIKDASSLTHGNEISIFACYAYTVFLKEAVLTRNIDMSYYMMVREDYSKYFSKETIDLYKDVLTHNFKLTPDDINESGYVVDTFKAVIFSLLNSNSFKGAVKTAVSLGYDTDTSACITGSLAGIVYGIDNIPSNWKDDLKRYDYLCDLSERFSRISLIDIDKKIKVK